MDTYKNNQNLITFTPDLSYDTDHAFPGSINMIKIEIKTCHKHQYTNAMQKSVKKPDPRTEGLISVPAELRHYE